MNIWEIFWAIASIVLFLMLIATICFAVVLFDQEIQADKAKKHPKLQEVDKELIFPELSYWEIQRAIRNARKTDEQLRKCRRRCCVR